MAKITTAEVRAFLRTIEGKEITLNELRSALGIEKYNAEGGLTESYNYIRGILNQLQEAKVVRYIRREEYRVIVPVDPVKVFVPNREDRPPVELIFPRDFDTMMEMDFAGDVVLREGDLITIGGIKSAGKTLFCLSVAGENIDKNPVLMGNEYTIQLSAEEQRRLNKKYDVSPRFYNRMNVMSVVNGGWINWLNDTGEEKFTLLPVWDDYAEHIVKDRLNIIDYVSLDADKLYDIGKVLRAIKHNLGRGIAVVAIQKREGAGDPRGGQFVRDSSDLELLLDGFGDDADDALLTIRGCKEKKSPIVGKTFAYTMAGGGTRILNFREVKKCAPCHASGYKGGKPCETCNGVKYVNK